MNKNFKFISMVLSLVFCLSAVAFGQETTGNLEGTVTDQAGARVAGVSIELVSDSFRRTVTTNEEGFFRALQLQPGIYRVTTTVTNFQPFRQENVQVVLGRTTPVNIQLAIGGVGAEVTVTDANALPIDPTSSRIQTNLTERELEQLPKGTNFTSALKAVPSVRPEPSAAGFAIDGATGVENSFIIDGQEVSNFRTGGLNGNNNLPFQLVRELQVKNSGFEAEFGGATGGVINVVTKSGGNDFHGEFGADFETRKLGATARPIQRAVPSALSYIFPTKDQGVDFFPYGSLSGPIIKDRLWFFASATPQFYETTRTFRFINGSEGEFRRRQQNDYYFGRVDAAITNNLRVYSTFTYNPIKVNGSLPAFNTLTAASGLSSSAAVNPASLAELGGRQPSSNFNINGKYVATPNIVFSARFSRGYINEKLNNYGVPNITRFQCVTSGFNCTAGFNNVS
ncbi:MAG: carboxypeptidase regulatory-like domain-containing protein, partial [Pyrinomonadaceae bacterium]